MDSEGVGELSASGDAPSHQNGTGIGLLSNVDHIHIYHIIMNCCHLVLISRQLCTTQKSTKSTKRQVLTANTTLTTLQLLHYTTQTISTNTTLHMRSV